MIVLDTNVIFELMRSAPDRHELSWFASQKPSNLAITTFAIAEIQRGILLLPEGKRRTSFGVSFLAFIEEAFYERILVFDASSAYIYGDIASEREKAGFNTDSVDLMIAAIVKNNKTSIDTRNIKDFKDCGIKLINPWEDRSTHG